MKVAIAFSSKDRVELTRQSIASLKGLPIHFYWNDGSITPEGKDYFETARLPFPEPLRSRVTGGADAAIVFALTQMLADSSYTHVGLCENDVLLAPDWFERVMALFDRGAEEGLVVGAASARAYDDRVLIQRDGWAVMHNLGAGHVVFTREAAQRVLEFYRTGWWPDNRAIFAQLAGIDIGRYACFRGNAQWVTADWNFDAILASHGFASVALTPCAAEMIGQTSSLEEQGLRLVDREIDHFRDGKMFDLYIRNAQSIRAGVWTPQVITPIHRTSMYGGASLIFPHQMDADWEGEWRLKWSQGFGPFSWRATGSYETGQPSCHCWTQVFGPCTFLVSGDKRAAKVAIRDTESGYEIDPEVPPAEHGITQLSVPGGYSYRQLEMTAGEGLIFYGIQTTEPQPISDRKFDYSVLPPV